MPGTWRIRRAAQRLSIDVVAIRRKEAIRQKTPLSIRVSMERMPPVMTKLPSCRTGVLSKKGLKSPTAITRGSMIRSL